MTVLEYMRTLQPDYPSEGHQRDFLRRWERAQELSPCSVDHSATDPPCHTAACYPRDAAGRMVGT